METDQMNIMYTQVICMSAGSIHSTVCHQGGQPPPTGGDGAWSLSKCNSFILSQAWNGTKMHQGGNVMGGVTVQT